MNNQLIRDRLGLTNLETLNTPRGSARMFKGLGSDGHWVSVWCWSDAREITAMTPQLALLEERLTTPGHPCVSPVLQAYCMDDFALIAYQLPFPKGSQTRK